MARRKQPPIHHQHADLISSTTEGPMPNGTAGNKARRQDWNGKSGGERRSNGTTAGAMVKGGGTKPGKEKQAGLLELVLCVGGIYVSLYVVFFRIPPAR